MTNQEETQQRAAAYAKYAEMALNSAMEQMKNELIHMHRALNGGVQEIKIISLYAIEHAEFTARQLASTRGVEDSITKRCRDDLPHGWNTMWYWANADEHPPLLAEANHRHWEFTTRLELHRSSIEKNTPIWTVSWDAYDVRDGQTESDLSFWMSGNWTPEEKTEWDRMSHNGASYDKALNMFEKVVAIFANETVNETVAEG